MEPVILYFYVTRYFSLCNLILACSWFGKRSHFFLFFQERDFLNLFEFCFYCLDLWKCISFLPVKEIKENIFQQGQYIYWVSLEKPWHLCVWKKGWKYGRKRAQ